MELIFTIVEAPADSNLQGQKKSFGNDSKVTIGRAGHNTWALPDNERIVSSNHASISFENGAFVLTDNSTNGTFVNDNATPLGQTNSIPLKEGDMIVIGHYLLQTSIKQPAPQSSLPDGLEPVDFFDQEIAPPGADSGVQNTGLNPVPEDTSGSAEADDFDKWLEPQVQQPAQAWQNSLPTDTAAHMDLGEMETDPLAVLDKSLSTSSTDDLWSDNAEDDPDWWKASESDHASPQSQAMPQVKAIPDQQFPFTPSLPGKQQEDITSPDSVDITRPSDITMPQAVSQQQPQDTAQPDNIAWQPDQGIHQPGESQPQIPQPGIRQPSAPQAQGLQPQQPAAQSQGLHTEQAQGSENIFEQSIQQPVQQPLEPSLQQPVQQPVPQAPQQPAQQSSLEPLQQSLQQPLQQPAQQSPQQAQQRPLEPFEQVSTPEAPVKGSTAESAQTQALADALGLENLTEQQKESLCPEVAIIVQETIRNLMDLLGARASIKNELRVERTMIRPTENNPLKFSPNHQEALNAMFRSSSTAFVQPSLAVKEGFEDISDHQIAVLIGMKSAFNAMLAHFNPANMEKRLTRSDSGRSLLTSKKAKLWENYESHFENLNRDMERTYRELFGEAFADAYENQLAKLKGLRRNQ